MTGDVPLDDLPLPTFSRNQAGEQVLLLGITFDVVDPAEGGTLWGEGLATIDEAEALRLRLEADLGRPFVVELRHDTINVADVVRAATCTGCGVGLVWEPPIPVTDPTLRYSAGGLCRPCDDLAYARKWDMSVHVIREFRDRHERGRP